MQSDHAELSSVGAQLHELTRRITEAAHAYGSAGREEIAHELYEVERSLRTAQRRLDRAVSTR